MKKAIIIIVLLSMTGWAVFDLVFKTDDTQRTDAGETGQAEEEVTGSEITVTSDNGLNEEEGENKEGLEIGEIAPDFQLQTLTGEMVNLSDYRGSRVMLNFWTTWCPPCRAEMPDMERFYHNKDVVILAVNLTETEPNLQQVEAFANEFGLTFPILLDEKIEVAEAYKIRPIPTTYMIDSNGIIQYKAFGAMNYQLMVQELEKMN